MTSVVIGERWRKPHTPVVAAAIVSFVGDGLLVTALPLLARTLTADPRLITGVFVAQLSSTPLSPVIAAGVDRYGRPRRVMVAMDLARAVVLVMLLVAVGFGGVLWLIYPAAALLGAGEIAFSAASWSLVREVCTEDDLTVANGQLMVSQSFGQYFGGPLAGGLLFTISRTLPLIGDAISFVVSSIILRRAPDVRTPTTERPLREVIREGWKAITTTPAIRVSTVWIAAVAFAQALQLSTLVLISDRVGLGARGFGVLLAIIAAGNLIGGMAASRLAKRFGFFALLSSATLIGGLAHLGAAAADRSAVLVGAALAVDGIVVVVAMVAVTSFRQRLAPPDLVGSVMSTNRMLVVAGTIPSGLLAGVLVNTYGTRVVLAIAGTAMVLVFMIGFQPLRRAIATTEVTVAAE